MTFIDRARSIAEYYGQGKQVRNGSGWLTLCVCHGNTDTPALSVINRGDDVDVYCHVGCDFKDIKDRFRVDGLLPGWQPEKKGGGKIKQSQPTQTKPDTPQKEEKPSFIWKQADKDHSENIKKYFANRAINIDPLPPCFKWNTYYNKKTGETDHMIVCAASTLKDDTVYGVQRLFVDPETYTKAGKGMMHGHCDGRGVWFDRKRDMTDIATGEGIETVLSVIQATGKNGVAALSTSGLKGLIIPEETNTLYVCTDSDPVREKEKTSMPGQKAAYILAEKFETSRPGRKAYLVSPDDTCFSDNPTKLDFNDLLKEDPSGATIRDRFEKSIPFPEMQWKPPVSEEESSIEQDPPWFNEALKNGSVSRFIDHEPPPLEWVFKGTLLARTTGLLVGPGAAGKSTLAILMCIAVATGRDILPGIFTPTKAGKVLGVFAEDDENIIHHRIHNMVNQLFANDPEAKELLRQNMWAITTTGHDVRFLSQAGGDLSESPFFKEVFKAIKGVEGLRLIVFDPVSRYHGAEENDNGAGTFLVSLLEKIAQQTGAAVLALHHVGKRAGADVHGFDLDAAMHQDASRGASGLTNGVRWQCNLFGLPEKNAKKLLGVSSPDPGQYLALKVCKKNYGVPEPVHFLERGLGGILKPVEPLIKESDPDLDETIRKLVVDFIFSMEGQQVTLKKLLDGKCREWKTENLAITRPAVEHVVASCILRNELHERPGKNASGRSIIYLSTYPEPDQQEDVKNTRKPDCKKDAFNNLKITEKREPEIDLEPEVEPEVLEPENRRQPEKNDLRFNNSLKSHNKVEPEVLNRRNDHLRFVSARNCGSVEPEVIPPYGGAYAPSGSTGALPPCPEEDENAEYF